MRRGFTLPELLLACALTALVISLLFSPFLGFMKKRQGRPEAQSQGLLALQKVAGDLRATQSNALTVHQVAGRFCGLGLVKVTGWTTEGEKSWDTVWTLIYWDAESQKLQRKTFPADSRLVLTREQPARFPASWVEEYARRDDVRPQVLAGHVTDFRIETGRADGRLSPAMTLVAQIEYHTAPPRRSIEVRESLLLHAEAP